MATERLISDTNEDVEKRIWDKIHEMEARRKALIVKELSFRCPGTILWKSFFL